MQAPALTAKGWRRRRQVLELIARDGHASQRELAFRAGCSRQRIGQVLGDLEDAGLIVIRGNQLTWIAVLTEAGRADLATPAPLTASSSSA